MFLPDLGPGKAQTRLPTNLYTFKKAITKGADQTVKMCRLVCAFVVHIQQNRCFVFSCCGPYNCMLSLVGTECKAIIETLEEMPKKCCV